MKKLLLLFAILNLFSDLVSCAVGRDDPSPGFDRVKGAWLNGQFYEPISSDDFERFPEAERPVRRISEGKAYLIGDGILGDYLGEFPTVPEVGIKGGAAYRFYVYPDSDEIILVKSEDGLEFYVTHK